MAVGEGSGVPSFLMENKMNEEIAHAFSGGILNPLSPGQARFNSLSGFVCLWAALVAQPTAPNSLGHRTSGSLRRLGSLMKFLAEIAFNFQKCRLQCELFFTERL